MNFRTHFAVIAMSVAAIVGGQAQQFERSQAPPPLSPAESARAFTVPDELEMELVLAEPLIAQPLHLSFDERGRLWVVEYRQYPAPAGLKQISHDKFWRSVYDQVPRPPPNHFRGKDRVSIHEDTNGDGVFDSAKVFVDGLNIATSVAVAHDGVWVLNPPYLLFYPDRDRDDLPDGDPEVHLSGFGLEDTHSVVNSLRWGPDGWLYACQGSTVSGHVKVEPLPTDRKPASTNGIHTLGQNLWRYHPATRRYEVFSEGGGNAFGIEMDAHGRLFSGHNGGDTRGFHYVQGAYLQKGFQKHGELSNPYAFGYFPQMKHDRVERFTHTFLIYEADALPHQYRGRLFGLEPMQGRVVLSEITPTASTFTTRDLEHVVTTTDRWFRPVDIKLGPDGAIYIADWHDFSINHWKNYQGNMDAASGRVWRLKAKASKPVKPFDLLKQTDEQLIALLNHPNRWWRETASRVLGQRGNTALLSALAKQVEQSSGVPALGALWTWHAIAARTDASASATRFLKHTDPQIRLWAVRFRADPFPGSLDSGALNSNSVNLKNLPQDEASSLALLAARETNVEVRIQLAATAKRLPASEALPIIRALAQRNEDAADSRQPLMVWWALEAKAGSHRKEVLQLLTETAFWERPLVKQHLLERLMRRYAQAGTRVDLLACAKLLDLSPAKECSEILMRGFETAFQGRSVAGLPDELITAMARHGAGSVTVGLRRGDRQALAEALKAIASRETPIEQRRQFVQVLGEVRSREAVPVLLQLVATEKDDALLQAVFAALQPFDNASIASVTLKRLPNLPAGASVTALTLLTSRAEYAAALVRAVEEHRVPPKMVPSEFARRLKTFADATTLATIERLWPQAGQPTTAQMESEITRLTDVLNEGHGDPYNGKRLYTAACAACHRLFNHGGDIGPDLTSFDRQDVNGLLLAIVNPNAEIREGYENFNVETRDERALSGFINSQDERQVILRGSDGQNVVFQRSEIATLQPAGRSLMPEGLLDNLDAQQVRDLFAYLRSSQPLND
ncbi:MAG: c-type cytochrome [Verrucomicrobia bacterium]|nr:c-type cytochrome [Verrucomicrobiota bacterium]